MRRCDVSFWESIAVVTQLDRRRFIVVLVLCVGVACAAGTAGAEWQKFSVSDGLAGDDVQAIMEDSSSNLWFGTSDGVSRYDGVNWRTYTTAEGLASNYVRAILEDSGGNLWFGMVICPHLLYHLLS
jgi:ligand-binding sensor domain-containing protein